MNGKSTGLPHEPRALQDTPEPNYHMPAKHVPIGGDSYFLNREEKPEVLLTHFESFVRKPDSNFGRYLWSPSHVMAMAAYMGLKGSVA